MKLVNRYRTEQSPLSLSILALVVAMISIQSGASLAKQLFPIVGAAGATLLRLVFATGMLFFAWRPFKHLRNTKLKQKEIFSIFMYGASLGGMNLLFYLSLSRIPLGIAVAFEFTGPLAVALFSSRKPVDFLWAFLAIAGILLILPIFGGLISFNPSQTPSVLDVIGVLYALGAGGFWALYIVFGQRAGKSIHGGIATTLGMLAATFVVLPVGLYSAERSLISVEILPIALSVALLSSAIPYSLEMIALKRLPPQTFGILMSIEPVIAAISGLLFLKEHLTLIQWIAIFLIILASLGASLESAKTKK